jgi:hypothetical protein
MVRLFYAQTLLGIVEESVNHMLTQRKCNKC